MRLVTLHTKTRLSVDFEIFCEWAAVNSCTTLAEDIVSMTFDQGFHLEDLVDFIHFGKYPYLYGYWSGYLLETIAKPILLACGIRAEWTWKMLEQPVTYFGTEDRHEILKRVNYAFSHLTQVRPKASEAVYSILNAYVYHGTGDYKMAGRSITSAYGHRFMPQFMESLEANEPAALALARRAEIQKAQALLRTLRFVEQAFYAYCTMQ